MELVLPTRCGEVYVVLVVSLLWSSGESNTYPVPLCSMSVDPSVLLGRSRKQLLRHAFCAVRSNTLRVLARVCGLTRRIGSLLLWWLDVHLLMFGCENHRSPTVPRHTAEMRNRDTWPRVRQDAWPRVWPRRMAETHNQDTRSRHL